MAKLYLYFRYPYNKSYDEFQDLVAIWNIKILKGDSHSPVCLIEISDKLFEKLFGSKNKKQIDVPKILQSFIIKVIFETDNSPC